MSDMNLYGRDASNDPIHIQLKAAVEREIASYLWVKGDTPAFKPALLDTVYGDGRALFALATINQRPRYYVIRCDSGWQSAYDREDSGGPEFAELTDDILTDLEGDFGRGRCGYCGNSLFWPREERIENCQCEECDDEWVAEWPTLDDEGGCSWGRMDWPEEFATVRNPVSWEGNLLDIPWVVAPDPAP